MTGERFRVERHELHWRVVDALQWDEKEQPRFEGSEPECRAVAAALHRTNGLHRSVPAADLGSELGVSLAKLADQEQCADVYNLLIELVDAVVCIGAEDAGDVARRIVRELGLGSVCGRCQFVYLGEQIPEQCHLCDTEIDQLEERRAA